MSKGLAAEFYEAATRRWESEEWAVHERGEGDTDPRYRECPFCDRGNMTGPATYTEITHQPDCLLSKVIAALGGV